jgi:hypothetical protein
MRRTADPAGIRELLAELARLAREPATAYLVGGATLGTAVEELEARKQRGA